MTKIKETVVLVDRCGTVTIDFDLEIDIGGMTYPEFLRHINRFEKETEAGMQRELNKMMEQIHLVGAQKLR